MDLGFINIQVSSTGTTGPVEFLVDPIDRLPSEIAIEIFSHISSERMTCALVNKKWKNIAYNKLLYPKEEEGIFDEKQWEKYIGKTEPQPHLPLQFSKTFKKEKCLLTFIPETVDGNPLTLNLIEVLVKTPKNGGVPTKFAGIRKFIMKKYGTQSCAKGHWLLLTEIFPESGFIADAKCKIVQKRHTSYDECVEMISSRGFEVPELFGTITSLFMHSVRNGDYFYNQIRGLTYYTQVKEKIVGSDLQGDYFGATDDDLLGDDYHLIVGGGTERGLYALHTFSRDVWRDFMGMAGARKSLGA